MPKMSLRRTLRAVVHLIAGFAGLYGLDLDAEELVDYRKQIRPLLSNSCYACHGPDRNGQDNDLRLDQRDLAIELAITPGDADSSELMARLTSDDPDVQMPPPGSNRPRLTADQIELIRRWIDAGAVFSDHWSYAPVQRPDLPVIQSHWPLNPIDHFVLEQNQSRLVEQAADADARVLIRRLSFDLRGLPPSPEDVRTFVQDSGNQAYESLVDKYLSCEAFGERMAAFWLDLVRYADTCGYHGDQHREIDAYRDFVIQAFDDNLPFDQFTISQIAGDLLPQATIEQRIASGYNRLLQTTEEGGAQPKEYMAIYAADRVRNASTVWLGSTLGCAQCHDHKFDPFTMDDFYRFAAFFADIEEVAVGRQDPNLELPSPEQVEKRTKLNAQIGVVRARIAELKEQPEKESNTTEGPDKQLKAAGEEFKRLEKELKDLNQQVRRTLAAKSVEPRPTRVLPRGNWLDESGPVVQPDIPALFGSLRGDDAIPNRTDLARWLASRDNPLTARVFVNHLWRLMFGEGLMRTPDDFGSQGDYPTHPELLDWLAAEFMESGWNVKHMVRLIANSRTYRQSSNTNPRLAREDPTNRWLARQNRFRLDAEMIRDNALVVSGLLFSQVGGASVKPYQPAGYWAQLNFPKREYQADQGHDQFRRGIYTYWCRTFLHPSLAAFDAPTREECTAQRPRSNTPLQALVLLNDPTYVEAARALAQRILTEAEGDVASRIDWAFGQVLNRSATPAEQAILLDVYESQLTRYRHGTDDDTPLLQIGQTRSPSQLDPPKLAAWTSVGRVLLNLHETITRY